VGGGTVVVVTVAVLGASATDNTGPILAFVGAVLVALIAAFTAGRRQKRALDAESERHANDVRHRATHAVFQHGQWTGERAPDAVREVAAIATSLGPIRQRLAVRFGDEHDAVRGVHAVQLALREIAHLLGLPTDHANVKESWTATQDAAKRFEDTRAELVRIAVRATGARLP
jgi:ABC-type nickel/cobalt efflux system permease component RcnA